MTDKAVVVISGGMDSVTLAYWVRHNIVEADGELHGISFNYGQRHVKELRYAKECPVLDSHTIVDLTGIQGLIDSSALTGDVDVPEGHYAADTMKQTVVPNRNMMMLSIATAYAVNIQATAGVWTGVHAGDHFVYPDCRPLFVSTVNQAAKVGNEGFIKWIDEAIAAPFVSIGKHDIVGLGSDLGVPYELTWSCYKGERHHCGKCGTCVERKEAFALAQVIDPTEYEDPDFEIRAYRG